MNIIPHLEVIIGPMFSGKSTELIRRVNLFEVTGLNLQVFKPKIDDRYGLDEVTSHDGLKKEALYVDSIEEMDAYVLPLTNVIGIEEVQFFDSAVIEACKKYVNEKKIVVVSGLNKNFRDEFFPFADCKLNMSEIIRTADHVKNLYALCTEMEMNKPCGNDASRTQKFIDGKVAPYESKTVQVGGKESYAPRCRQHFQFYK